MSYLVSGLAGGQSSLGSGLGVGGLGTRIMVSPVQPMVIAYPKPRFSDVTGKLVYTVILDGALSFVGDMTKKTNKVLSGAVSFVGTVVKSTSKLLTGGVSFVGTLLRTDKKLLDGAVGMAGTVVKSVTHKLSGSLGLSGDLGVTDVPPAGGGATPDGIFTNIVDLTNEGKIT